MKQSDIRLILESTDGVFSKVEVPQLYVEIQKERAKLERKFSSQLSFCDAMGYWMDEIYNPIMNALKGERVMQRCKSGKTLSEIYFDIYDEAETDDFSNITGCVKEYVRQHPGAIRKFFSSISA